MASNYSFTLYDSIAQVNDDHWDCLGQEYGHLVMDRRYLAVFEKTYHYDYFKYLIIYDDQGEPAACSTIMLSRTDGSLLAAPVLRKCIGYVRKFWPGCMQFAILYCGMSIMGGSTACVAEKADSKEVLRFLDRLLRDLGRKHKTFLTVFQELSDERCARYASLLDMGYVQAPTLPQYVLQRDFHCLEEYISALKSDYKYTVRKSIKKMQQAGCSVHHVQGAEKICAAFTDEVYRLHVNVAANAGDRDSAVKPEYVYRMAEKFPEQTILTIITRNDRIVGFIFGLILESTYYLMHVGLDYEVNREAHLYFNLVYASLGKAWEKGATKVFLGKTADYFKSRVGAVREPRSFFITMRPRAGTHFIRLLSPWLFTETPLPPPFRPFLR